MLRRVALWRTSLGEGGHIPIVMERKLRAGLAQAPGELVLPVPAIEISAAIAMEFRS